MKNMTSKSKAIKKSRNRRRNFFPTFMVIIILLVLLTIIVYFFSPFVPGIVFMFFVLVFLLLLFFLSTIFVNTRRGLTLSIALVFYLLLRYLGIGNILNFLLIVGVAISIEAYFSQY